MAISAGQRVSAANVNAAFISKTDDTTASGAISLTKTTNATSSSTGALICSGGVGIAKDLWIGGKGNFADAVTLQEKLYFPIEDNTSTGSDQTLSLPKGIVRLTGAIVSIVGITAPTVSMNIVLINDTGSNVLIKNNTTATAANRILTGSNADINLIPTASAHLTYDLTETRWRYSSAPSMDLSGTAGGVVYTNGNGLSTTAVGSSGQILRSVGATAPTWSTATFPNTTTANRLLYSSSTNTIADLATANSGTLVTNGSGVPSIVAFATAFASLSPLTTKGDVLGYSSVNARVPIGTDGQVLTADSAQTLGLKWATPSTATASYSVVSKTTTYGIAALDDIILCSASAFTVTLPTAVGVSGKAYRIQKTDSSLTNIITIATTSSQTIGAGGGTTTTLNTQGEELCVFSDGANWIIDYRQIPVIETNAGAITITATTTNPVKGTTSTDQFIWWRTGRFCNFRYSFVETGAGSPTTGSGIYKFGTPTGLTADTTNMVLYTSTTAGDHPEAIANGQATNVGSSAGSLTACFFDSTHWRMAGQAAGGTYAAVGGGFYPLTQTIRYALIGSYPVSGWNS